MSFDDIFLKELYAHKFENFFERYLFLDRYINDGSPSGFELGMPFEYHPLNDNKYIKIYLIEDVWEKHLQIGKLPPTLNSVDKIPFFIHPVIMDEIPEFKYFKRFKIRSLRVQPTASGRTVSWEEEKDIYWFIKLHFPLKLGRFKRELNLFRWLSALERSKELLSHANKFPHNLAILNDIGGTYYQNNDKNIFFGTIFRNTKPQPKIEKDTLLIPSFSLFSIKNPNSLRIPILQNIITTYSLDQDKFLNLLVYPLLDTYLFLATSLGMLPEYNAQNILYEFDIESCKTRIVIRDLGDCFIDILIREKQNLHTIFCSYKTIDPQKHFDLFKRRSFTFDFKLSQYIILPLLKNYSCLTNSNINELILKVKEYFNNTFPDNLEYFNVKKWYSYPKLSDVSRSTYLENINPLFR